jgi:hypothetical protein
MKNKNKLQNLWIMTLSASIMLISACKDNPPPDPTEKPKNENELITTMVIEFEDSFLFKKTYATFQDLDGEGGNAPSRWDTIKLVANRPYITKIILLDESKSPTDTISNEVLEEGEDHLFVFTPTGVDIQVKAEDKDDNNLPIGLFTIWRTGNAGSGKMKVRLKHQPGVKDGTAGPGDTDVDIDFNCLVE